jgi:hypothetical protein
MPPVRFQDDETMRTRGSRFRAAIALPFSLATPLGLALCVGLGGGESPSCAAEVPTPQTSNPSAGSAYRAGLALAQTRGVPMVVIVTAQDQPESLRLWSDFRDGTWARTHRGLALTVQVCREQEPQLVKSWGIVRFPSVLVFGRDPKGGGTDVTLLRSTAECDNSEALAAWLGVPDAGPKAVSRAPGLLDPSVLAAALGADAYPSPQQQLQSPPVASPAPPAAPPYSPPAAPTVPAYASPLATTTAGVIQVPGQNYVIQQSAPQIFMAPAQMPIVYVPQQTQGMAMAAPMMPVAPAAPAANMFLPAGNTLAMAVPAAAPMVAAPAPAAAVGFAAPAASLPASVTNQTLSLPASRTATRVRVRGPGLFGSSMAKLGERLVHLGHARIITTQETTLEAPYTQNGTGLTTISTTSAAPLAPQPTSFAPPVAPPFNPPAEAPPPPQPSPQTSAPRKHSLFFNHE